MVLPGLPAVAMSGSAPSTATVLEYRCLFTHDLRRKQKRWQDGRLKYHSFNARVMVYDERGNSVGDMHWHGEYDFGEGEEVQLDRGGVIVQVEELVERRETDLTELVDKRIQEKQQRQIQQLARSAAPSAVLPRALPRPTAIAQGRLQTHRHQPLHRVIGTPTGHHGKALVPKESPYEHRQQAAESPDDRASKRRKYDDAPPSKSGYASALFGQTLTLSATPSSSVPAIRRPRPEAGSDPPEEADTRDTRDNAKSARREQTKPSRRLNQSGYAQSLFGQTLTLSHTPVSSVSSRPPLQNEPHPNPAVEDPRETARPGPPPQPVESRHLDQHGRKPRSASLSGQTSMGSELAKGSPDTESSKADSGMSRRKHATITAQSIPENVEIIEIDDPKPVAPLPIRKPRNQKTTLASLRTLEEDVNSSNVAEKSVRSRKKQRLETGPGDEHKKAKNHERTKKTETAVSKVNANNASSDCGDDGTHKNITRVHAVTRDPALPVTELRIKSSKKRGLLMISDTSEAKKTRRRVAADSVRPLEGGSGCQSRDSDSDDPFRSPPSRSASKFGNGRGIDVSANNLTATSSHVPSNGDGDDNCLNYPVTNHDGQWENEEAMSELEKMSAQRTISTELGEVDDTFRSPSPAISEQTCIRPEPTTRDSDMQAGSSRAERVGTSVHNTSDAGLFTGTHGRREPADTIQPAKRLLSPPRVGCDPYQIPPSPQASSPSSAQEKRHGDNVGHEILRPIDNNKKQNKAKKQRNSRRKVVSDDDDADDTEPLASPPRNSDAASGSDHMAVSTLAGEASKKQSTRHVTSRKSIDEEDSSMADKRPKRAARESGGQQKEHGMTSDEDELPIKRRQSTRQRRSQVASYEEPSPLLSEQDGSEEEEIPRKRRKTKTSKAQEDRPRLEKIKKNVKSRELIGFNLAALNAPLGLRGIGMPFGILPSPVIEPKQRQGPGIAAVDEVLSPEVTDGSDRQMLPPGPNPPALPSKMSTEAQRKSPTATSNKEADRVILAPSEPHVIKRSIPGENLSGELDRVDGPGNQRLAEDHDPKESDAPANEERLPGQEASSSEDKGTSRQQPAPSKPRLAGQQPRSVAPTPQDNTAGAFSGHSVPSLAPDIQDESPTGHKQSSTGAKHSRPQAAPPEVPAKTITSVRLSPALAPARPTKPPVHIGVSLRDRPHSKDQQPSKTGQTTGDKKRAPTEEARVAANTTADPPADALPMLQTATPLNHQEPGLRRQPSTLGPVHAPITIESDSTVLTYALIASPAVDKPDSALDRHSLTSSEQTSMLLENNVGNQDSDTASGLPVRQSKAIGLRRQVSAPRRINNIAAKSAPQAETTEGSHTAVHTKPITNARLANPASRGRKAALASDAAGQAPQRVLPPTQPALMVPISTADLAMTPIDQAPKEPERPKKKMTFPGFQSARSDGPWSREAFDLLESGRPE